MTVDKAIEAAEDAESAADEAKATTDSGVAEEAAEAAESAAGEAEEIAEELTEEAAESVPDADASDAEWKEWAKKTDDALEAQNAAIEAHREADKAWKDEVTTKLDTLLTGSNSSEGEGENGGDTSHASSGRRKPGFRRVIGRS